MHRPIFAASLIVAVTAPVSAQAPVARTALNDIVGVWQSDTVSGTSAVSTCAASPAGSAVVCEQIIRTPAGNRRALNVFTVDTTGAAFVFYNLSRVGDAMVPVRLVIENHIWAYGGGERAGDGQFHRTINDFSNRAAYTWRLESSSDSVHWVPSLGGKSRRIR